MAQLDCNALIDSRSWNVLNVCLSTTRDSRSLKTIEGGTCRVTACERAGAVHAVCDEVWSAGEDDILVIATHGGGGLSCAIDDVMLRRGKSVYGRQGCQRQRQQPDVRYYRRHGWVSSNAPLVSVPRPNVTTGKQEQRQQCNDDTEHDITVIWIFCLF